VGFADVVLNAALGAKTSRYGKHSEASKDQALDRDLKKSRESWSSLLIKQQRRSGKQLRRSLKINSR